MSIATNTKKKNPSTNVSWRSKLVASLMVGSGDTKHVLTGSADNTCRLWDCQTGEWHVWGFGLGTVSFWLSSWPVPLLAGRQLAQLKTSSAVRTCGFDFSGNIIMFSTDKQMGYQCYLNYFDLRDPQQIGRHLPENPHPCYPHWWTL